MGLIKFNTWRGRSHDGNHWNMSLRNPFFSHAFLAEIHPGKLPWNTIMEVWKMIFFSFGDPNQNLHFHERINYIVMASQPRPHLTYSPCKALWSGLMKTHCFPLIRPAFFFTLYFWEITLGLGWLIRHDIPFLLGEKKHITNLAQVLPHHVSPWFFTPMLSRSKALVSHVTWEWLRSFAAWGVWGPWGAKKRVVPTLNEKCWVFTYCSWKISKIWIISQGNG